MKLHLKNGPSALKGKLHNEKDGKLVIVVEEEWGDTHMYVWKWHEGTAGTRNENSMVYFSTIFDDIRTGKFQLNMDGDYRI